MSADDIESVLRAIEGQQTQISRALWRGRGSHPRKAILGGPFGFGGYEMASHCVVANGLHWVTFFVLHKDSQLVIALAETKQGALEEARRFLRIVPPLRLAEMAAKFAAESAAIVREQSAAMTLPPKRPPSVRRTPRRRLAVYESSEGKCHYCAKPIDLTGKWHIEHKMPRALFGSNEPSNLVASCIPCNLAKRDRTDQEFIAQRRVPA